MLANIQDNEVWLKETVEQDIAKQIQEEENHSDNVKETEDAAKRDGISRGDELREQLAISTTI